ncbi:MAG: PEP-CTERM sorting domain-containing protein [Phycisphaerales bacterium]|nr:MAG: PEP-CTERM sorting domain-containing protein [Phycisphaerales bacterium]
MVRSKLVVSACALGALAGAAGAQVVNVGESYNALFFGSGDGGFIFASPWANTTTQFDGNATTMSGQPTNFIGGNVGDPVSYQLNESQFANGDGTFTIRVEVSAASTFLAPGLDFDPFSPSVDTLDTLTFDLGATTFGTNNGIRTVSNDITFVSANITWFSGADIVLAADATQRITISLGPQIDQLATGTGLRGQFSIVASGGDVGALALDRLVLDMIVVPAPGALALLGLGGLVATRRRRA